MQKEKTVIAQLRHLRIPPRKARLQANVIRGLSADEAQAQLMLSPRRAGNPILKLLKSAIANAKYKKLDPHALVVKEVRVDQGPKQKRWMPRARGAWGAIQKWTSHITIVLEVSNVVHNRGIVIYEKSKKKIADTKKKEHKHEEHEKAGKKELVKEKEDSGKKRGVETGALKRVFRRKAI